MLVRDLHVRIINAATGELIRELVIDPGVGLIYTTGPKAAKLARKYAPLMPVLAELIARPDTPLTRQAKARILRQLQSAEQRFAAIAPANAA